MSTNAGLEDQQYEDERYEEQEYDGYSESDDLYEPYRSVSKAAVFSLIFAVLAVTGLLFPALLIAAVAAVTLGLLALKNLRRYPDELTGKTAAVIGCVLGGVLLVGGIAMHSYIYLTEVPDGYQRISYSQLQPREDRVPATGATTLPVELDGKRVFVKGYIHPGVADLGELKKFILVPDMGTCCFGGQPKLTDMIEVTITGKRGLRYTQLKRKLAGTFHVSSQVRKVAGGLDGGYYELDADYAR